MILLIGCLLMIVVGIICENPAIIIAAILASTTFLAVGISMVIYSVVIREVSNTGCVIHAVNTFSMSYSAQKYAEDYCARHGEVTKVNEHYFSVRCEDGYKEAVIYVSMLDKTD